MALLLCSHPDGALRDIRPDGTRPRRFFPLPQGAAERLHGLQLSAPAAAAAEAAEGLLAPATSTSSKNVVASILVRVTPAQLGHQGVLTVWTQEGDALWNYHKKPRDAYTVHITDVYWLSRPVEIATKRLRSGATSSAVRVTSQPVFRAGIISSQDVRLYDLATRTVLHFDLSQALRLFCDGMEPECYWLPAPVFDLVKHGSWRTLLFSASWPTFVSAVMSWPSKSWFENLARSSAPSSLSLPLRRANSMSANSGICGTTCGGGRRSSRPAPPPPPTQPTAPPTTRSSWSRPCPTWTSCALASPPRRANFRWGWSAAKVADGGWAATS